jgi:hypothetical protein
VWLFYSSTNNNGNNNNGNNNNGNNNNGNNNNDNGNAQSGYSFCQTVYTQNARSVSRCCKSLQHDTATSTASYYNVNENYSSNANGNYDDAAADAEDDLQEYNVPSWYKSDLTKDELQSTFATCKAIVKNMGKFRKAKIYDSSASGSNFVYSPLSGSFGSKRMHPMLKVFLFVAVVASIAFIVRYFHKLGSEAYKRNPLLVHHDAKQQEFDNHNGNGTDFVQMDRSLGTFGSNRSGLSYKRSMSKSKDMDGDDESDEAERKHDVPIVTLGNQVLA